MGRFPLCGDCAARFSSRSTSSAAKTPAGCFICRGLLSQMPSLADSAVSQAASFEWDTFSVSSSFPRSLLLREQEIAQHVAPGAFTSIKNSANSALAKSISGKTGKRQDQRNPEALFEFSFIDAKASAKSAPLYIYGHYIKLSRRHCQSRWHCSECGGKGTKHAGRNRRGEEGGNGGEWAGGCGGSENADIPQPRGAGIACASCGGSGRNYQSVEDALSAVFSRHALPQKCTLHASGREDVDVRCLGTGRPFVLEITSPKKRKLDFAAIEAESSANPSVRAVRLRAVPKYFMDAVCNSHFEKKYAAVVSADRLLSAADARKAESLSGALLSQQTPSRVLSRRADMLRRRRIIALRARAAEGGKLELEIVAEAGTYIKELISSDAGRTEPSLSSVLCCKAECDELDVVEVRDYFLETLAD